MASSRSIKRAQIPMNCSLCQTETNIKWKCIDCDLFMCSKCKEQVHSKIKTSKKHEIIDIKQIGIYKADIDFTNIQCSSHLEQLCCLFCESCHEFVCAQCVAKIHKMHSFSEIKEGYQFFLGNLRDGQKQLDHNMDTLVNDERKLKEIKNIESNKNQEAKKQIKNQNEALKKAIDRYTEKILRDLDQKWKSLKHDIEEEEKRINSLKQKIKSHQAMTEDLIGSNNVHKLFQEYKVLENSLKDTIAPLEIKFNFVPKFLPGEITQYNIGSLQQVSSDINLKILNQYTTDIGRVFFLTTNPDGTLWISDNTDNILQKVAPEGTTLKVITTYNIEIFGMAVILSGDLLLVDDGDKIRQMNGRTGDITDSVYKMDSLYPTAVHITRKGNVIVGLKNPVPAYKDIKRRVVVLMEQNGAHKMTCEYDNNRQRIFTYIDDITSTNTGTIFVVDSLSEDYIGRVVVVGLDGDVINIYNGHPSINNKDRPFKPTTILSTPSDNIIIPNREIHTLHILNCVGNVITTYNTRDIGIQWPYSLGYAKTGHLFIGCNRVKGRTEKAKLYQVDLTGC